MTIRKCNHKFSAPHPSPIQARIYKKLRMEAKECGLKGREVRDYVDITREEGEVTKLIRDEVRKTTCRRSRIR